MPRIRERFISFFRDGKRRREYTYATIRLSTVVIRQEQQATNSVLKNQRGKSNNEVSVNRRT